MSLDEFQPLLTPAPYELYRIPIKSRPPHGSLTTKFLLPIVFFSSSVVTFTIQCWLLPLLGVGLVEDWLRARLFRQEVLAAKGYATATYNRGVGITKDLFGGLLILVTVLFAPTTLTITSDESLDLGRVVVREDPVVEGEGGEFVGFALPENLVVMSNHQAYLDWIYIWILAKFSISPDLLPVPTTLPVPSIPFPSSTSLTSVAPRSLKYGISKGQGRKGFYNRSHGSRGLIILLKRSLKWLPILGWSMQYFRFIFLDRSWATDRQSLTSALTSLSRAARDRYDLLAGTSTLGPEGARKAKERAGNGLWLLIFPEGTITSDEERAKSVRYADREGVPDFVNVLHPRATGILFCLRTLLPQVPDLKVLDVTIGYAGVTRGGYAQEWYNLGSVLIRGVPPPTIHIHLSLIDPRKTPIPGIGLPPTLPQSIHNTIADKAVTDPVDTLKIEGMAPLANDDQAKAFNLWLRGRWEIKEEMLDRFSAGALGGHEQGLASMREEGGARVRKEVVPIEFM